MLSKRLLCGLFVTAMTFIGSYGFGAGFALYEGSARGNVLGGLTGHGDDAAAVFYNPAGITNLEGTHIMGGLTLIYPYADLTTTNLYDPSSSSKASYEDNIFYPPHAYYTKQLNDKWWLGVGFYSRFGLGSEFDDDWDGRYSSTNADIATVTLNPNIAVKVNDNFSLAFGVNATYIDVTLEQAIDSSRFMAQNFNDPRTNALDAKQTIEGDNLGYGFNLAAFFKVNDQWSFGLTYNSKIEQHITGGTAKYERPSAPVPDTWFVDTNVDADPIDLPESIFFGASYKHSEKFGMGFGVVYTGWGSLERLTFNYENPIIVVPGLGVALDRVSRELQWEDVFRYNVGFEYKVNDTFNLMWGVVYDESPVPDETISYLLPTNDRLLLNLGFGKNIGEWLFEMSYNYLSIQDRTIAQRQLEEGVLASEVEDGGAHLLGFSLSRKF